MRIHLVNTVVWTSYYSVDVCLAMDKHTVFLGSLGQSYSELCSQQRNKTKHRQQRSVPLSVTMTRGHVVTTETQELTVKCAKKSRFTSIANNMRRHDWPINHAAQKCQEVSTTYDTQSLPQKLQNEPSERAALAHIRKPKHHGILPT